LDTLFQCTTVLGLVFVWPYIPHPTSQPLGPDVSINTSEWPETKTQQQYATCLWHFRPFMLTNLA